MTGTQVPPSTDDEPATGGGAQPPQSGSTQLAGTAALEYVQSVPAVPMSPVNASHTENTEEATEDKSRSFEALTPLLAPDAAQKAEDHSGPTLPPRAAAAPLVSPPQVGSHEAKPGHLAETGHQPGPLKEVPAATNTSAADTLKGPGRASSASDSASTSDPISSAKPLTPTSNITNATGLQAEGLTSFSMGLSAPIVLPGDLSDADAPVATQAIGELSPTPAVEHRDKAQEDASGTAAEAPGSGKVSLASSMPILDRAIEGSASAVEVAALRDTNAALTSSTQTTQRSPGHDGGQVAETVRPEIPVPGGGMGELTQARVLHSLTGSEMRINLNSEDFGRVSVHTAYGREVITSQISLENSVMGNALSSALNAHLPTLVTKLGQEHGLSSSVTLAMQGGAENRGADREQNSDPRSQSGASTGNGQAKQHGAGFSTSPLSTDTVTSAGQSTLTSAEASSGRLDIRI